MVASTGCLGDDAGQSRRVEAAPRAIEALLAGGIEDQGDAAPGDGDAPPQLDFARFDALTRAVRGTENSDPGPAEPSGRMEARESSSASTTRPTLPPGIMFLDPASPGG
jgi:hypothetical protein